MGLPSLKILAGVFVFLCQFAWGTSVLATYENKKIRCDVGFLSESFLNANPYSVDFKLVTMDLDFNTAEAINAYSQMQRSFIPKDNVIISMTVKYKQGTYIGNFLLPRNSLSEFRGGDGSDNLMSKTREKQILIQMFSGTMREKFILYKNGEKQFSCTNLRFL